MGIRYSRNTGTIPPRKCERKAYKKLNGYVRQPGSKAFVWKNAWIMIKVSSVYDGDTITAMYLDHYGQEVVFSVRLLDVDCAEMPRRKDESDLDRYEVQMARAAKARVEELALNKICWLKVFKWDKYGGRVLGWVYPVLSRKNASNLNISQILIQEGLAVEYHGNKKKVIDWKSMCH